MNDYSKVINTDVVTETILKLYQHPHPTDVAFQILENPGASLLIGTNYADSLLLKNFKAGKKEETIAVKTTLKWTMMGTIDSNSINCNFGTKRRLKSSGTLSRMKHCPNYIHYL